MSGFFPHLGGANMGFTPLAISSFTGVLTDIVNDIGAGVNGWVVHDDRRGDTNYLIPCNSGPQNGVDTSINYTYWSVTNGSNLLSQGQTNATAFRTVSRSLAYTALHGTGTVITFDSGTNYYTVQNSGTSYQLTLDRNYTQTTNTTIRPQEKPDGYVILKNTNTTKDFYIGIFRPHCYGDAVRVQTFENWNATTHSGSGAGPMEIMRAYENGYLRSTGTAVQYMMWLLPGIFSLYTSANPADTFYTGSTTDILHSDLFYAGVFTSTKAGDTAGPIVQMCSNQEMSGLYCNSNGQGYMSNMGCAAVMRNFYPSGTMWHDIFHNGPTPASQLSSFPNNNRYLFWPRAKSYLDSMNRAVLDDSGRFQLTDCELYQGGRTDSLYSDFEGKRGDLKYIKVPMFFPSSLNRAVLGPADDGNTYIVFKVDYPSALGGSSYSATDLGQIYASTGFSFASPAMNVSDIVNSLGTTRIFRYFALPINI